MHYLKLKCIWLSSSFYDYLMSSCKTIYSYGSTVYAKSNVCKDKSPSGGYGIGDVYPLTGSQKGYI